MKRNLHRVWYIAFASLFASLNFSNVLAQNRNNPIPAPATSSTPAPASTAPKTGIRPYKEVITDKAKTDNGLFKVHRLDNKYFYEIPDSLFDREMLVVTRYAKTPTVDGTYGGEELNEQVWKWQRRDRQVFIRVPSYRNIASQETEMFQAVKNSNLDAVLSSFDIKALNTDSNSVVIDVTDLYSKDVQSLGLPQALRTLYKITTLDENRTYIDTVKSFPINIEVRSLKTYRATDPPGDKSIGSMTVEIHNSMLLLPKVAYQARFADDRVGFFGQSQTDYGLDAQKAKVTRYIRRWKLEPKDPAAYKRGELVEPTKQIIYYIDPATPAKWRPYLIAGVKDWNVAFEAAGFKNAITAMEAPVNDPDWSPEDARYSVIRYFASNIANAYGPHIADPRSGEIIESDIGWYHNVMNLVRNWFFVQTAAINPDARTPSFKDEIMGQLIRFVSSHEVGHTLGLPHNFGSSVAYPVDSLRSPSFTKRMGGTAPSIMDYARFNYIAQPGDEGVILYPGIGDYDKWAIKWGYTWFDNLSPEQEAKILNKWTVEKAGNPVYFYGQQTGNPIDPRSQSEDLGDDAVKASMYGIANLKRIVPNIEKWTYEEGQPYSNLQELYGEVLTQWNRYMGHVRANIGGIYEDDKTYEQEGSVYTHVPQLKQKNAVKFLNEQAFATPFWLLDHKVLNKFDNAGIVERLRRTQVGVLNGILDFSRLSRVIDNSVKNGSEAYGMDELFADLRKGIWSELRSGSNINTYRRNLQRAHIERISYLLNENEPALPGQPQGQQSALSPQMDVSQSDVRPMARYELKILATEVKAARPKFSNSLIQSHLDDILVRIEEALNPKK
ncbi:MAG: zinc-dependent metalloprotease [Daejeonella sp.]|uniref:zinc-dependent metalloprotease n=1 Tax=Daejeonella sp. JGW-45 TaxID=3034148 RepID=UPI0023EDF87C|nr:zinc-dependent metalloprotease [Daejeonella sp. JGW-45]